MLKSSRIYSYNCDYESQGAYLHLEIDHLLIFYLLFGKMYAVWGNVPEQLNTGGKRMKTLGFLVVLVVVCLFTSLPLMAWTQFNDGGTHNISTTINDDVWVDYQAPGMQTTVNLLAGGIIQSPYLIQGFGDSRINVLGGSTHYLIAHSSSQVTIFDGQVDGPQAYDNSHVIISGGQMDIISASDNGVISMSGGSAGGGLNAYGNSQVTLSGGSVGGLGTDDNGQIIMSGGGAGSLYTNGNGRATITGGGISYGLTASGNSRVLLSSGSINGGLTAYGSSQVTIRGSNFTVDGTPLGPGMITSILGGESYNEPYRWLAGILADGSAFSNQFRIGNSASINLVFTTVPEPSSLIALGTLPVPLLFRRRRN